MSPSLRRGGALILAMGLGAARVARAQDSQFGIKGLGTPARFESVRARSTGGAFAAFDATSLLADAALGDEGRLAAWAFTTTSWRRVTLAGANADVTTSRFPQLGLSGPIGHGLALGGGFSTYLDRSYDLVTKDTILVRGVAQPVTDHLGSDGGVADARISVAARIRGKLAIGVGFHLLTGSSRVTAQRVFADTSYTPASQTEQVSYDGVGFSASAIGLVGPSLRLAAFARTDSRLRARLGGTQIARNNLPVTLGGALGWELGATKRLAASVIYQSWADAGQYAHNTTNWSVGAELGNRRPLRLGARGGRMPFSPAGAAPQETGLSIGTGLWLRDGRGLIDLGLEHLQRTGAGLHETVWTALLGITVRP